MGEGRGCEWCRGVLSKVREEREELRRGKRVKENTIREERVKIKVKG